MYDKLISIIVPVYNAENTIGTCVDSLVRQSHNLLEIILVDDGSTDNSGKICDELALKDNRIKVIHKDNEGVSVARNAGINKAIGYAVSFVDADDTLDVNALSLMLNKMLNNDCDIVMGDYSIVYSDHIEKHVYREEDFCLEKEGVSEFLDDTLKPQSGAGFIWGKLFNREFLIKNNLLLNDNLAAAEDAEFMLRAAFYADKVGFVAKSLYNYLHNTVSAVRSFRTDYVERYRKSLLVMYDFLVDNGLSEHLVTYDNCVLYHLLLIVVNYSFNPAREDSKKEQILAFKKLVKDPFFANAMKSMRLKNFSMTRKITLVFIKLKMYRFVRLIAVFRQKQTGKA